MKAEILAEIKSTFVAVFWVKNLKTPPGILALFFDILLLTFIVYGLFFYLLPTIATLLIFFLALPVLFGISTTLAYRRGQLKTVAQSAPVAQGSNAIATVKRHRATRRKISPANEQDKRARYLS